MDDFEVKAQSSNVLQPSHLVGDMDEQASKYRSFPVVINGMVHTFHDIRGGYDESNDYHIVKLVQNSDAMGSWPDNTNAIVFEVDLDDSWLLYAADTFVFFDEQERVLSLAVELYEQDDERGEGERPFGELNPDHAILE